jgi:hypothetical protein
MSISYKLCGRFGNNLFEYFATKVISRITNKKYVFNASFQKEINEIEFENIYKNNISNIDGDIVLHGYFQKDFWITKEKEYMYSLLTEDNNDRINENYTVKDLVLALKSLSKEHIELVKNIDTLVVHIRLDDFYHQGYNSEVIDPYFLKDYIIKIMSENDIKKCIYIVDILKRQWEVNYMNIMLTIPNSIILNNDMLIDFSLLFYSSNLMVCRSTFAWISSACSIHNKKIWLPVDSNINTNQHFNTLGNNTITFIPTYMKTGGVYY